MIQSEPIENLCTILKIKTTNEYLEDWDRTSYELETNIHEIEAMDHSPKFGPSNLKGAHHWMHGSSTLLAT